MEKQVLTSLWNKIGQVFATNTQLATLVESKQDKLTAGQGIRIQNGVITNTVIPTTEGKEIVQVVVSSESATVSGLILNVYYNGESDPSAQYETDENGMCAFDVPYGYVYQVTFPSINGYKDIPAERHTATIIERSIEVEYEEIEDTPVVGELVKIALEQKSGETISMISGVAVNVTVDGATTAYTTDAQGIAMVTVPYGKTYTVTAPQREGQYLHENRYSETYTAEQTGRVVLFTYRQYASGLFIVADDGVEYTLDQWESAVAGGSRQNSEAMLIKVSTGALVQAGGVFAVDIDHLRERSYGANRTWASQNEQFNSIPLNGNSSSANYYYDGLTASRLIQQEGNERAIDTLAADQALAMSRVIAAGSEDELTLPGFLGSVGQWKELWLNAAEVDDILLSVRPNGTYLFSTLTTQKWTSTQINAGSAYGWGPAAGGYNKVSSCVVLPFFAY